MPSDVCVPGSFSFKGRKKAAGRGTVPGTFASSAAFVLLGECLARIAGASCWPKALSRWMHAVAGYAVASSVRVSVLSSLFTSAKLEPEQDMQRSARVDCTELARRTTQDGGEKGR